MLSTEAEILMGLVIEKEKREPKNNWVRHKRSAKTKQS